MLFKKKKKKDKTKVSKSEIKKEVKPENKLKLETKSEESKSKTEVQSKQKTSFLKKLTPHKILAKIIILVVAIVLVLAILWGTGIIVPSCSDDSCFNANLNKCYPSTYTKIRNNNVYEYDIGISLFSKCKLDITMKKTAEGTDQDIKQSIEGKSMSCKIPKTIASKIKVDDFENMLSYCTGPLKEGMYELMLKRMYGLVVSQMSNIVKESQKVLKEI